MRAPFSRAGVRIATLALGGLPLASLALRALAGDGLGANPVEEVTHATGIAALRFLVASLAVTPARRFLGLAWLAPERRTLGLLAYAYASLHFATYLAFDLGFELALLGEELAERPYIAIGFAAFATLTPLAFTSTRAAMRRLGRSWTRLHRLAYLAAPLAAFHFVWLVKADMLEPAAYAAAIALLLASRTMPARELARVRR